MCGGWQRLVLNIRRPAQIAQVLLINLPRIVPRPRGLILFSILSQALAKVVVLRSDIVLLRPLLHLGHVWISRSFGNALVLKADIIVLDHAVRMAADLVQVLVSDSRHIGATRSHSRCIDCRICAILEGLGNLGHVLVENFGFQVRQDARHVQSVLVLVLLGLSGVAICFLGHLGSTHASSLAVLNLELAIICALRRQFLFYGLVSDQIAEFGCLV